MTVLHRHGGHPCTQHSTNFRMQLIVDYFTDQMWLLTREGVRHGPTTVQPEVDTEACAGEAYELTAKLAKLGLPMLTKNRRESTREANTLSA